jgi:hypothetical protein
MQLGCKRVYKDHLRRFHLASGVKNEGFQLRKITPGNSKAPEHRLWQAKQFQILQTVAIWKKRVNHRLYCLDADGVPKNIMHRD